MEARERGSQANTPAPSEHPDITIQAQSSLEGETCQEQASHESYRASSFRRGWKCQNGLGRNIFNKLVYIPGENRKPDVQSQLGFGPVGLRAVHPV